MGAAATRTTWASPAINKAGRSGPKTLVTLHHHTSQEGQVVITEEQDIVYRSPAAPATETASEPTSAPSPSPDQAPGQPLALNARDGASNTSWDISPVFLFRFSALTYNAHRIHYDRDYARDIEGYPGLLVHGPHRRC